MFLKNFYNLNRFNIEAMMIQFFSTTFIFFILILSMCSTSAESYDASSNQIIDASSLNNTSNSADDGIRVAGATQGITFNGNVIANKNKKAGIAIGGNSIVTFDGNIVASENDFIGVFVHNSNATFVGDVIANENKIGGVDANNSTANFQGAISVKGNNYGIDVDNSVAIFDELITASDHSYAGIVVHNDSTATFRKDITLNENEIGVLVHNSTAIFDGKLSGNKNNYGVIVRDNSRLKFNDNVLLNKLIFEKQIGESEITIGKNVIFDTLVATDMSEKGSVNFLGSATVNQVIGSESRPLKKVQFEANDINNVVKLNADITANEILLGTSLYKINNDIALNSRNIKFANLANNPLFNVGIPVFNVQSTLLDKPIFDLGLNTLKFSGSVVHDDADGLITINTMCDGSKLGHVEMIKSTDSIDLTNSKGLVINITEAPRTLLPLDGEIREFDLFVENGAVIKLHKDFTINNSNQFVSWVFDPETGILSQKLIKNPKEKLDPNENWDNLNPDTAQEIFNIAVNEGIDAANEALSRLTNVSAVVVATAPVNLAMNNAIQIIGNRAHSLSVVSIGSIAASDDSYVSGVAASGDNAKYGAWISPFYGVSSQKSKKSQPGYKSSYFGGVVGFDTLVNDQTTLGIAFGFIKNNIKHKDQNFGDTTKADSLVVSAYSSYKISKEWFVQLLGTIGSSKINNKEIRKEFSGNKIASSSYSTFALEAEILSGYNYKAGDNVTLTPLFGLGFNRLKGFDYKESGTNTQNLEVSRKDENQWEAILGARVSSIYIRDIFGSKVEFVPELHGNIRYSLFNHKLNVDIIQDGINSNSLVPTTVQQARIIYNTGCGVTVKYNDQWEYVVEYNARLADKYIAHQGTLKARLNF